MKTRRPKRRGTKASRRRLLQALGVLLVVALVLVYTLMGDELRFRMGLAGAPLPRKNHEGLRIGTWNMRKFAGDPATHDLERMAAQVRDLHVDVLAVQEIEDGDALRELLPEFELALSEKGGRGHQRLGVLWNPSTIEAIGEPIEHVDLGMKGHVRPGYSLRLRGRERGPDFVIFVVHLKAMPEGSAMRREQWNILVDEIGSRLEDEDDVIVLGDFNVVGGESEGDSSAREMAALDTALASIDLRRVEVAGGCSAYWDGARRDAWKEPSLLDLVYIRDLRESLELAAIAHPATHCQRHACGEFRSTESYPDPDFAHVSDHCPVVVDLRRSDDD